MATKPKVLYFLSTDRPTNYDLQVAAKMNANVVFRNWHHYTKEMTPEQADAVFGPRIPFVYSTLPTSDVAIQAYEDALNAEATAQAQAAASTTGPVGNTPAPAVVPAPATPAPTPAPVSTPTTPPVAPPVTTPAPSTSAPAASTTTSS